MDEIVVYMGDSKKNGFKKEKKKLTVLTWVLKFKKNLILLGKALFYSRCARYYCIWVIPSEIAVLKQFV